VAGLAAGFVAGVVTEVLAAGADCAWTDGSRAATDRIATTVTTASAAAGRRQISKKDLHDRDEDGASGPRRNPWRLEGFARPETTRRFERPASIAARHPGGQTAPGRRTRMGRVGHGAQPAGGAALVGHPPRRSPARARSPPGGPKLVTWEPRSGARPPPLSAPPARGRLDP